MVRLLPITNKTLSLFFICANRDKTDNVYTVELLEPRELADQCRTCTATITETHRSSLRVCIFRYIKKCIRKVQIIMDSLL